MFKYLFNYILFLEKFVFLESCITLTNLSEEKICLLGIIIYSKNEAKIIPKVENFSCSNPFCIYGLLSI